MNSKLTVLFPVHNEERDVENVICGCYRELSARVPVLLLAVEDGSTDNTKDVLRRMTSQLPLHAILGPIRLGYSGAMKVGLSQIESDLVFVFDSDGQAIPSEFWKIYEFAERYDMVLGKRALRYDPPYRLFISKVFHLLASLLFRLPVKDIDTSFRIIRRDVIRNVLPGIGTLKHSFWAEFTIRACRRGYTAIEVSVRTAPRTQSGTTLYGWKKLPRVIVDQLIGLLKLRTSTANR
jgi:glycosyltransferase involved in cell wall biosynthesis